MTSSPSPAGYNHNGAQSKAEVYSQMAKELRQEMHSIFICTECKTKGKIVVVTDTTLPMGTMQADDSWALRMVKMNTRYELHPAEISGPSGTETAAELRRRLQLALKENAGLQAQHDAAIKIIERMRGDHEIKMKQQWDNSYASHEETGHQTGHGEQVLELSEAKHGSISIECDTQNEFCEESEKKICHKQERIISLMEQKEEANKLLHIEKGKHEDLQAQYMSLDSMYQNLLKLISEEQKKNLELASGYEKLTEEHQQLHSNHEALRAQVERNKPLIEVGVAIRLRWLENVHFILDSQNGRILDEPVVEVGNAAAHHANFEADLLLVHHVGLSTDASDRVSDSIRRIYGDRHAPVSPNSLVTHTYPPSIIFTIDCKAMTTINQSQDGEVGMDPQQKRLRTIAKEMMTLWGHTTNDEEFETLLQVKKLREEVAEIWGIVQITYKSRKRRIPNAGSVAST